MTEMPQNPDAASGPIFSRMRTRLILLVLLPVIPMLALTFYTNLEERQNERARVREGAEALSQLAAAKEENFVKNTRQLLATLAEFPFLVFSTNRMICETHFTNLCRLSPDYQNFGLIEADGTLFCSAVKTNGRVNVSDRSYFQRVVETRRFAIGDFQVSRLTHLPSLNFSYPVLNGEGALVRVLFASLKLSLLNDEAAQILLPNGAVINVIDRTGTVLAQFPEPERWVGQSLTNIPFVQQILKQHKGTFEGPGIDGVPRLYAVTPIRDGNAPSLFVSVGIPVHVSFARADFILVRNLTVLSLVGLLTLAAARFYGQRYILKPVVALVAAAKRLADGDLKARSGISYGGGELSQLARAFDGMADTLEKRQVEIERAQAAINQINSELEQRVKDRTAQLEGLNRELEAFSYSVSHDLRAPLRHIDGFAQMLRKNSVGALDEKSTRYLGVIGDSAKRMGNLIDDLLAFSRMGRREISDVVVDTGALIREIIAELETDLRGRSIEWSIADLPQIRGDSAMLRVVWVNLISNAVKYTRPKEAARIEIGFENNSSTETIFYIRDNGVGFDMQYADNLFGVFQRLHRDAEFEGTGIGLASVRRVINRHGGRTWAEGQLNEGASFYFSIPKPTQRKL